MLLKWNSPRVQRARRGHHAPNIERLALWRGARYVPAGVYMVNTTLIIRKPSENTSVAKPQPYVTTGLRMVGEGT